MKPNVTSFRKNIAIPFSERFSTASLNTRIDAAGLSFPLLQNFRMDTVSGELPATIFFLDNPKNPQYAYFVATKPSSLQTNVYLVDLQSKAEVKKLHVVKTLPAAERAKQFKPAWIRLREASDWYSTPTCIFTRDPHLFVAAHSYVTGTTIRDFAGVLVSNFNRANEAYRTGKKESHLTDAQFDALEAIMGANGLDNVSDKDGYTSSRDKEILKHPMGSLTKAAPGDDIPRWAKKYGIRRAVETVKIDGNSLQLHYIKGKLAHVYTKGETANGITNGREVTKSAALIPSIPKTLKKPVSIDVRAEAFMDVPVFEKKYKRSEKNPKGFKNPRNAVAGAFNRETPDRAMLGDMRALFYNIFGSNEDKQAQLKQLSALGFPIPSYRVIDPSNLAVTDTLAKRLETQRKAHTFEMDGLVIEADDAKQRAKIGNETNSSDPAFARAFKVDKDTVTTTVSSVVWKLSKDKYLKPTVYIKPVEIDGVTVSKATGFNAAFIVSNKIGPGAVVEVKRAGDVIPKIENVIRGTKAQMPDPKITGPYRFNDTNIDIILTGGGGKTLDIRKLLHFFEACDIRGIREQTIVKFYDAGYTDIPAIVGAVRGASPHKLSDVFGDVQISNFRKAMSKFNGISMPTLMYASGCFGRSFGSTKLAQIYKAFKDDAVYGWKGQTVGDVASTIGRLHGFSRETGIAYAKGVPAFQAFLKSVRGIITPATYAEPAKIKSKGKAAIGQVVCFSKIRSPELSAWIVSQGGEATDKWSSNVTILITPPGESSEKTKKAIAKNVPVMSIEQYKKKYGAS